MRKCATDFYAAAWREAASNCHENAGSARAEAAAARKRSAVANH
jgi:hypothetical protein